MSHVRALKERKKVSGKVCRILIKIIKLQQQWLGMANQQEIFSDFFAVVLRRIKNRKLYKKCNSFRVSDNDKL